MSRSARTRRMARNHRRMATPARLNLVALMDIFTILVLFLIVNNGDVEVLQSDRRIALPDSVSEQRPHASLIVKVTDTDILVAEEAVMTVAEALAGDEEALQPLRERLVALGAQASPVGESPDTGRAVIIMGDQGTPYTVLRQVLATCAAANYRDVSLAVDSRPASAEPLLAATGQVGGLP